jgi:hypothetical protein
MAEMIEGKDREETIRLTAEFLEISVIEAAFIWGQEHGEIKSDVIIVEENRNGRRSDREHRTD